VFVYHYDKILFSLLKPHPHVYIYIYIGMRNSNHEKSYMYKQAVCITYNQHIVYHISKHILLKVSVYINMYVCLYVCLNVTMYLYVCMYMCMYMCMYVYVCVCMCMYVYVYVYVCVCMYAFMYTVYASPRRGNLLLSAAPRNTKWTTAGPWPRKFCNKNGINTSGECVGSSCIIGFKPEMILD